MAGVLQDVHFAVRTFRTKPGFFATAALMVALGIGANTAIFTMVDAVLLRPLPFADAQRLVLIWQTSSQNNLTQLPFAYPNFDDLRHQSTAFESLAAWSSLNDTRFNLIGADRPEQLQYAFVSANFFSVFGVSPLLGRGFETRDDQNDSPRVAVVSHGLWQRRFGSDPQFVGKTLLLDGQSYTVVGIMPQQFAFPRFPRDADIWIPLALDPNPGRKFAPGTRYLNVIGRLKPDVSLATAQAEVNTIVQQIAAERPDFNRNLGMRLTVLQNQITQPLRKALLSLLGAVGFVLLIACANVANLLMARAASRHQEIAVRSALGASRWRIVRQLLTESLLLALVGGALGVMIAVWMIDVLSTIPYNASSFFSPYHISPDQIRISGPVLIFTAGVSLVTGLLFGLVPALRASREDINTTLKGRSSSSLISLNLRDVLVIGEVALAVVLLIGAGLMIKSFLRLSDVDAGFDPVNVVTAEINLPRSKYGDQEGSTAFYRRLLERVEALPSVDSTGLISSLPLSGLDNETGFLFEGRPIPDPRERPRTHNRVVSPDYFRTLGVPLLKGRKFTSADNQRTSRVALVNETMARRYWPGEDPIGKRIALDFEAMRFFQDRPPEFDLASGLREIVGIVRDVRHIGLETDPAPEMYVPLAQSNSRDMSLVVRSASDPANLSGVLRREVLAVDPEQPLGAVKPMPQLLSDSVAKRRFNLIVFTLFAAVALILTAAGVYGVTAYSVSQRTREIGIRMALGAQRSEVLRVVIVHGSRIIGAGICIGLSASFALTRLMASLLFGVSATDPIVFAEIGALLGALGLLACYLPARRATRIDPIMALRHE